MLGKRLQCAVTAVIVWGALGAAAPAPRPRFPEPAQLPSSPQLPDPLLCLDGTKVTTREQWETKRKPELRALFQHYMYGYFPPAPKQGEVRFEVKGRDEGYFGGKATKKEVTIRFGPEGTPPMRLLVVLPNGRTPVAVFVGPNFHGNHTLLDDPTIALPTAWVSERAPGGADNKATDAGRGKDKEVWNIEHVVGRGYGVATFYCGDLDPDKAELEAGIQQHYYKPGQAEPGDHDWATIAAWAFGIHRALDYLHQDPSVDKDRIAVVGHSRLGKTALLAAAFDERIDLVIPLQAGCGGTAPSSLYTGSAAFSTSNCPAGFAHWSSTALGSSTGRGAHRAIRQCWSKGRRSGCSLNFLKVALNQCGKRSLICFTDSPTVPRLGAVPPQPDWSGMTRSIRSSNAAASSAVLPRRE